MKYVDREAMEISRQILKQRKIIDYAVAKNEDRGTYGWESSSSWEKLPENGTEKKTGISSAHAPNLMGADSVY